MGLWEIQWEFSKLKSKMADRKRKKQELQKAKAVFEKMETDGIPTLSMGELDEAASVFFENEKYEKSRVLFDEYYRRLKAGEAVYTQDDKWRQEYEGHTCKKAAALNYFGYGGVACDMDKAGEMNLMGHERDMDSVLWEADVLGVCTDMRKIYDKPCKLKRWAKKAGLIREAVGAEKQPLLMTVDRERMEALLCRRYEYALAAAAKKPHRSEEKEKVDEAFKLYDLMLLMSAFADLEDLGYWQAPRTVEGVENLFWDAAQQGDAAAMYWLASCAEAKMILLSEDEQRELYHYAAQCGHMSAINAYARRYADSMPEEEAAHWKETMLRMKEDLLMQALAGYTA